MAAQVADLILNGLLVGSVFALGGVGLTLVYSILKVANFSHGDLLTTGGFVAWVVVAGAFAVAPWQLAAVLAVVVAAILAADLARGRRMQPADRWLGVGAIVLLALVAGVVRTGPSRPVLLLSALVVSAIFVALFSVGLDRLLWRRMRRERANIVTLMIISIGVAFALRSLLQMVFGGQLHGLFRFAQGPNPSVNGWLRSLGLDGLSVTNADLWILGTALVAVVTTQLVLTHTRTGKAMRALADNRDLARVSGIDTERVVTHVWLLGGALAGLAGPLLALQRAGFVQVNMGWDALLSIFAAVILGGIGSATGAMLGGLVIGVAQELSTIVIPSEYKLAVGFAILIVTLLVRPQGIMGVRD